MVDPNHFRLATIFTPLRVTDEKKKNLAQLVQAKEMRKSKDIKTPNLNAREEMEHFFCGKKNNPSLFHAYTN